MSQSVLIPCEGCGALFPPYEGPTHRYLGASAACWALFNWHVLLGEADATDLPQNSRVPERPVEVPARDDATLDSQLADAYGVQHHGGESARAVQSVALHLLNLHAIVTGKTTHPSGTSGMSPPTTFVEAAQRAYDAYVVWTRTLA